jgi:hypothetical protein
VVSYILEKARETKVLRFRHCARLLPCTHICKAEKAVIAEIAKAAISSAGLDRCMTSPVRSAVRFVLSLSELVA